MKVSRFSTWAVTLSVMALSLLGLRSASGCPFCSAPSLTFSEQVAQADAVLLVKWTGGQMAKDNISLGTTDFEIIDVTRQPDGGKYEKGGKVQLTRYRPAKVGDEFMLFGTKVENAIEWGAPLEVSKTAYEYIRNSPKPTPNGGAERLKYFMKYLEIEDKMIADDAYGEFANAAYADVAKLSPELPRQKIKQWLFSKETSPGRAGLYGMMLGLCGTQDDAKAMEEKILEPSDDFRLGIDGVMGGYLLLTKDRGLKVLEDEKLKNKQAPFSETYAAMQAVRFMWQYGDNRISADRLRESMRVLLDRPELADLVIADLSRMKDWSVQDRLMEMYDEETNIPSVKRAIVRYMLSSTKDVEKKSEAAKGDGEVSGTSGDGTASIELPAHVLKGQKCLAELERKDPKTVSEAKRFFLLK